MTVLAVFRAGIAHPQATMQQMSVQRRYRDAVTVGRRFVLVTLAITAIFAATDILWLPHSNIEVSGANFTELAKIAIFLMTVYGVGKGVQWRLRDDRSRMAGIIATASERLLVLARAAVLFIPLGLGGGVFMYIASAEGMPLMDAQLALVDGMLGFDWLRFLAAFNANPGISAILIFAYHSVGPQIPATFLFLAFSGREIRLLEFIALIALTSLLTAIGMALVPAAGAYPYYAPEPEAFSSFTSQAGMWHFAELMKLRSGAAFVYLADRSQGLVTFPSFHTALGITITYVLRDIPWIFPIIAILNAIMILSTIPEGGHHLVDVLAGLAIAVLCISFVRILEKGAPVLDNGNREMG